MNLIEIEYVMLRQLKMQPSELWAHPFYEIEYLIDLFKKDQEEQEKQRKNQEDASGVPNIGSMGSSMMRDAKNSFNSMTSGFKMPK